MQQRNRHGDEPPSRSVRAWDLPTRLFHWTLVTLVVLAYVSRRWGDAGLVWHTWNGYAVLVLVVWRLLWGFVGTSTSRFASFVTGPVAAFRYAIDFALRRPRHLLGHNPLGGLAVLALLAALAAQGFTGLFAYDDHDSIAGGPLSGKVPEAIVATATRLHLALFDALLIVVALHIAAQALYLVWKRENLVQPMITGLKPAGDYEDEAEARTAGAARAIACLVVAVAVVFGGVWAGGGKIL
ncbi:MAG: cytochrome b/b6 domain-containing protein [Hyphomicrobiaceae bacterium]